MIIVRKQNSLQAKQPTLYLMDFRPLFPELIIKGLNKALKVFRHYFYLTPGKFIYELFFYQNQYDFAEVHERSKNLPEPSSAIRSTLQFLDFFRLIFHAFSTLVYHVKHLTKFKKL